jgi:hypothetical protein
MMSWSIGGSEGGYGRRISDNEMNGTSSLTGIVVNLEETQG